MPEPITIIVAVTALLSAICALIHTTCRRSECTMRATTDGIELQVHTEGEEESQPTTVNVTLKQCENHLEN